MSYRRAILPFLFLGSFLCVVSCSSKPAVSQARDDVQKYLDVSWPGLCKIVSFNKTNGEGDSERYTMHYRYTAEILCDNPNVYSRSFPGLHICAELDPIKWVKTKLPANTRLQGLSTPCPQALMKGDVFEASGRMPYRKTENGWTKGY